MAFKISVYRPNPLQTRYHHRTLIKSALKKLIRLTLNSLVQNHQWQLATKRVNVSSSLWMIEPFWKIEYLTSVCPNWTSRPSVAAHSMPSRLKKTFSWVKMIWIFRIHSLKLAMRNKSRSLVLAQVLESVEPYQVDAGSGDGLRRMVRCFGMMIHRE